MKRSPPAKYLEFLARVITEFCGSYAPDEEIQENYKRELAKYEFSREQWDQVFSALGARYSIFGLPPVSVIRAAINDLKANSRYSHDGSRRGMLYFRVDGREPVLLVQLEHAITGDYWAISSVQSKRGGEIVELQKHVGMDAFGRVSLIPGAEVLELYPLDPALRQPGELPTLEEIAEFRKGFEKYIPLPEKQKTSAYVQNYVSPTRAAPIPSLPANDNYNRTEPSKPVNYHQPQSTTYNSSPTATEKKDATRKELPRPADSPEDVDGGYYDALLNGGWS